MPVRDAGGRTDVGVDGTWTMQGVVGVGGRCRARAVGRWQILDGKWQAALTVAGERGRAGGWGYADARAVGEVRRGDVRAP